MDIIKVNNLENIGDSKQGCLHVSDIGVGHIGRITFSIPPKYYGYQPIEHSFATVNPPPSNPNGLPSVSSGKSAEEILKKALEYVKQESLPDCEFTRGMNCAKRQMAAHLEMLIMEAKQ